MSRQGTREEFKYTVCLGFCDGWGGLLRVRGSRVRTVSCVVDGQDLGVLTGLSTPY